MSFDDLKAARAKHAELLRTVERLTALLDLRADPLKFCCANPPYADALVLELPLAVYGPLAQKKLDDAKSALAAMEAAKQAYVAAAE